MYHYSIGISIYYTFEICEPSLSLSSLLMSSTIKRRARSRKGELFDIKDPLSVKLLIMWTESGTKEWRLWNSIIN